MTDFTFITASDIHISDKAPRSRLDNFKESILDKLFQMGMACKKLSADGAIIAGDLFNLKQPSRNSHALNRNLVQVFKSFNCPVFMIEGNHDLTANDLESIVYQPLGVLFEDKTIIQLRHEIIKKESNKISLIGIPYTENIDISKIDLPDRGDCACRICVMHIYSAPSPGNLFGERIYGYKELSKIDADIFILGHYHIDQGIERVNGKYFINLGSLSRGTISDEDISHHPKIGLLKISIDKENIEINAQGIKLKVKPANEIFDLQKREEEKKESEEIKLFVEKLITESNTDELEKEKSYEEMIKNIDVGDSVKNLTLHYIEKAIAEL